VSQWPSTKARRVYAALIKIGWSLKRKSGSHRTLQRNGWPDFVSPEKSVARVDSRVYDRFVGRYAYDSREVSIARRGTRQRPSGE